MKYLVRFTEDSTLSRSLPAPAIFDLVEATRPYFEELKKRDKVVDYGFFGVGHGLYAIFNVRGHGELHELTELTPVRLLCTIESQPVLEAGEFADAFARIRKEATAGWEKLSRQSRDTSYVSKA